MFFNTQIARQPGTDYKQKLLQYKQRNSALENESIKEEEKRLHNEMYAMIFAERTDKKRFRNKINARVEEKFKEYEEGVDQRRERLGL